LPSATRSLRALACLALGAVLMLGGILGWLKLHEDELIFVTQLSHPHRLPPLPGNARRIQIPAPSNTALAAVEVLAPPQADLGYWILHLHGNADTAFSPVQVEHVERLAALGFNVLGPDYRGYGLTPGQVSEQHMYEDAEAAYRQLRDRGVPDNRIILWGHSLGSGPAVYLASRHAAAALVLFGAFTSIPDMAAQAYPWLPVRWLVGIQFDSVDRLLAVHVPVLIAHSVADKTIPFSHAGRNFAAAHEPKRLLALDYPSDDGFGGHVNALYDHLERLKPLLAALLGARLAPPAQCLADEPGRAAQRDHPAQPLRHASHRQRHDARQQHDGCRD
jgi:pimeloyl-ACP methyl ester carboxylesterase